MGSADSFVNLSAFRISVKTSGETYVVRAFELQRVGVLGERDNRSPLHQKIQAYSTN